MNKVEIFNYLKSLPGVEERSSTQLRCKCFLCGDSKKNPYKKRLGIKCDISKPEEPILYNCFNCFRSGVFTVDMMHQLEGFNPDVEMAIRSINKKALHNDGSTYNRYKNTKEISVKIPPLMNNEKSLRKAHYIYKERGFRIPIEDMEGLKIIWNLGDFLLLNNIKPANDYVNLLDRDYVGFLSVYNEYIIFRDITNKHKMRYVKYNIFNVFDNSHAFYRMTNRVNLLSEDDIHIIIAEGIFDLIGIRYHLLNNNIENKLFLASCNGSFIDTIFHYIRKGFVGENIIIDCYQDNDTRLNFKNIREQMLPFIMSKGNFNVYYNVKSKDFGVPKENILVDRLKL